MAERSPDTSRLSRIAAAVGLARTTSTHRTLVSEGIQQGRMRPDARRLDYDAGARSTDLAEFAKLVKPRPGRRRPRFEC